MFHFTFSVIDVAKYGKNSVKILEYIFRHGRVHISDLKNVVANYITYSRTVSLLEKDGIVSIEVKKIGGLKKYITLTDKGVEVCRSLGMSKNTTYEIPASFAEESKNLSAMVHFNVKDDHIAVAEHNYDGSGKYRIVYVYTKPNGHNVMRLWCDVDESFDCVHTRFAWTLPDVQAMMERSYADRVVKKNEL